MKREQPQGGIHLLIYPFPSSAHLLISTFWLSWPPEGLSTSYIHLRIYREGRSLTSPGVYSLMSRIWREKRLVVAYNP